MTAAELIIAVIATAVAHCPAIGWAAVVPMLGGGLLGVCLDWS